MAKPEVIGLFPTPLMCAPGAVAAPLRQRVIEKVRNEAHKRNVHDQRLAHTDVTDPLRDPVYADVAKALETPLTEFGALLLGERVRWLIKEFWVNTMQTGGGQAMHNHANSFVSIVVYLTETAQRARTVFYRPIGGGEYAFSNENRTSRITEFNAKKWQCPPMAAGDAVLFPSYLLHEVPPNEGPERMTIALNALPERLDSWGYQVRFS